MALHPIPYPKFHAGAPLAEALATPITEVTTWQALGGVLTNPNFYAPDTSLLLGRAVGMLRTTGEGVELQIVEIDPADFSENEMVLWEAPDTSGAWATYAFTTAPPAGTADKNYIYELRGRLNNAQSADLKYYSLALLQL